MKKIDIDNTILIELTKNHTINEIASIYNCTRWTINKKLLQLNIKAKKPIKLPMTKEHCKNISLGKKKFYKENPEKHIWKKHDKFKSIPCEKLKEWLKSKRIEYIDEYTIPESEHNYSLDIAFPDKQIAIEVNGNQHYNKDGTLSEYYQKRHDYIESLGWKLYELHFSICFHLDKIENMIPTLLNSPKKIDFDYKVYIKPLKEKFCPTCNKKISKYASYCRKCAPGVTTLILPERNILEQLVWIKPLSHLAIDLKCSLNGLIKSCIRMKINLPPKGYWIRINNGKTHDEALKPIVKKKSLNCEKYASKNFTKEQIIQILDLISNDISLRKIAKKFNTCHQTISKIKYGKRYKKIINKIMEERTNPALDTHRVRLL